MQKLIFGCAPAGTGNGSNLGMNTVDYALHNLIIENKLEDHVEVHRPWPSYIADKEGKFPYYQSRDFHFSDVIYNDLKIKKDGEFPRALIYWGDFQHGFDYQVKTSERYLGVRERMRMPSISKENSLEITKNYFLLNDHFKNGELPFKIAMYGVTLFQNSLKNYLDEEYLENLKWLYKEAIFAKSRESYSAGTIAELKGNYKDSFLGVDCALLNHRHEILSLPQNYAEEIKSAHEGNIGFFFGRSSSGTSKLSLIKFLNKLAFSRKQSLLEIPWAYFSGGLLGGGLGKYNWGLKKLNTLDQKDFLAGDILGALSNMSLVVTDTYHVAINCITLGVPVVCIYEPSPKSERNANMGFRYAWRDKRALLFTTNNMTDFLIASEDLKSQEIVSEKIDNINYLLEQTKTIDLAYGRLKSIAKSDRESLGRLFKDLVLS